MTANQGNYRGLQTLMEHMPELRKEELLEDLFDGKL
jgi:hypothetical protein